MSSSQADQLPEPEARARGAEVLLVDRDKRVREGLRKLLSSAGVVVTATDDPQKALDLASEKYFAVAVVDIDTPDIDGGLSMVSQLRERSAQTKVLLLAARQTFDVAARGFRAGAVDVVPKEPSTVKYLTDAVIRCCAEELAVDERTIVLSQTQQVLDQFFERLMAASRKAMAASDEDAGRPADGDECTVLIVDDNPRNGPGLQRALGTDGPYRVVSAVTGGEALDCASTQRFQLALVKTELPDLPSTMVVKGLRTEVPDGIVLAFTPPTNVAPGRLDLAEGDRSIEVVARLERGEQLVASIHELREAYQAKQRERRYLRAFRDEHNDLLRSYVELKQRLSAFVDANRRQGTG